MIAQFEDWDRFGGRFEANHLELVRSIFQAAHAVDDAMPPGVALVQFVIHPALMPQ
jgi:hypothetical protein